MAIAQKGGRQRWRIENEGFNRQKNSGLNLEHVYSIDLEKWKAYYCLLQIAFILTQLLERGSLLRQLVASQGKPLPHRRLLQSVWGPDYGDETEYLRVVVNQLRKKLEADPAHPKYILTEPWVGYRFERPKEPAVRGG